MFLEGTLVEKLRKLEALHAGTKVDGEREAAKRAAERIRARLEEMRGREKDVVFRYRIDDPWRRKLFTALCRRYGLEPYRDRGRRYSTIQVRAPKTFHEQTLFPEFVAFSKELATTLDELTDRVIREAIHDDTTEAADAISTKALPGASGDQESGAGDESDGSEGDGSPT